MTEPTLRGPDCVVAVLGTLAGCASGSTRGDFETVSTLVEQRAELQLIERDPEKFEQPEPDVSRLLAQPLTVEAAVQIALLNNRELRAAFARPGRCPGRAGAGGSLAEP